MMLAAKKELKNLDESREWADREHDLTLELSKRLEEMWRYDQYIAHAEGIAPLQAFWRELKRQDEESITLLKQLTGN